MAHNLAKKADGTYAMVSGNNETPWHKLGTVVAGLMKWEDAYKAAGLDYEVIKRQLQATIAGNTFSVPAWGIFRSDNNAFLGSVGAQYRTIQNIYPFQFVDTLLEAQSGAHYETAGALGNGERIWCCARVPFDFEIGGTGDKHRTFLMFTTSHDGSESVVCKLTDVRTVCENTLLMGLRDYQDSMVKIRHTKNAEVKLDQARMAMQGVQQNVRSLQEKLTELAKRRMTKASMTAILDRIFPKKEDGEEKKLSGRRENIFTEILEMYDDNDHNAFPQTRGTAYNLLNAYTNYVDHKRTVRLSEEDKSSGKSEENARIEQVIFGKGVLNKNRVFETIFEETARNPRNNTMEKIIVAGPSPSPVSPVPSDNPQIGSLLDDVLANGVSRS